MIKILFVCHGNICRSPMAEFIMKDLIKKAGLTDQFTIASAATSTEEIGSPPHPGTRRRLNREGISVSGKYAVQMIRTDYAKYDYLIGMDRHNIRNMRRISGSDPDGKIHLLLDYCGEYRDVDDPWYTGDFEQAYDDILAGCQGLYRHIMNQDSRD